MRHTVSLHDPRRGAALIIAISIMTILLAIALTFYAVTRVEVKTATNVVNAVRVEFLADAAVAIAVSTLNQDLIDHPQATSLDHPWRSVYSGAAFAGKPWAMRNGVRLDQGGVPQLDVGRLPYVDTTGDGLPNEQLYLGPVTRNWLFIPRAEPRPVFYDPEVAPLDTFTFDYLNPGQHPFVTAKFYGQAAFAGGARVFPFPENDDPRLPQGDPNYGDGLQYAAEQVHQFADVDNSGNGLRDSMWVPLPIDLFFRNDGIDNDLDGMIDEQQDDGIDHDLDGDEGVIDTDGDGIYDFNLDIDEAIEGAPFVYWAGNDGLDNDGDGFVDRDDFAGNSRVLPDGTTIVAQEPHEYFPGEYDPDLGIFPDPNVQRAASNLGFFLTSPLPGIQVKVDLNADGVIGDEGDLVQTVDADGNAVRVPAQITLPDTLEIRVLHPGGSIIVTLDESHVDSIDNDYNLLVNDYYTYAFLGPYYGPGRPEPMRENWWHVNNWTEDEIERYQPAIDLMYNDINLTRLGTTMSDGSLNAAWKQLYANPLNFLNGTPVVEPRIRYEGERPDDVGLDFRLRVTHTGEPVCELVGRAAIYIKDEQSKVNPNAAGAHVLREQFGDAAAQPIDGAIYRAMDAGATTAEYETRVLPGIGVIRSGRMWAYLTGSPRGFTFPIDGSGNHLLNLDSDVVAPYANYFNDIAFPGYGGVDDNANALVIGLNGINDKGNFDFDTAWFDFEGAQGPVRYTVPLADEGLRLPRLSTAAADVLNGTANSRFNSLGLSFDRDPFDAFYGRGAMFSGAAVGLQDPIETVPLFNEVVREIAGGFVPYFVRLGLLEGIDEPGELQLSRPLRNLLAENDGIDNSGNQVIGEFGELADRTLRTNDELINIMDIGEGRLEVFRRTLSPYGADRNLRLFDTGTGIKTRPRLDFNRATPQQMAAEIILTGKLRSVTDPLFRARASGGNFDIEGPIFRNLRASDSGPPDSGVLPMNSEWAAFFFAEGLKRADVGVRAPFSSAHLGVDLNFDDIIDGGQQAGMLYALDEGGTLGPLTTSALGHRIPEDPVLAAMQAAVDIADARDPDHARTTLTTEKRNYIERPAELARAQSEQDAINNDPAIIVPDNFVPYQQVFHHPTAAGQGPRERVPADELFHLESVQDYAETQLQMDDAPLLEFADRWWSRFVTNDSTGETLPEERRISYTVTGNEAVRINEIMARPVRRVEAEATPDVVNFGNAYTPYSQLLDPTPYAQFIYEDMPARRLDPALGGNLALLPKRYAAQLPEFHMKRREMTQVLDERGLPSDGISRWRTVINGPTTKLGPDVNLRATTRWTGDKAPSSSPVGQLPGHPGINMPNAVEYLFVASPGLPAGRYYLTINTNRGQTDPVVTSADAFRYSIKYVPVVIDPDSGDIQPAFFNGTNYVPRDGAAAIDPTDPNDVNNVNFGTNTILGDLATMSTVYPVDPDPLSDPLLGIDAWNTGMGLPSEYLDAAWKKVRDDSGASHIADGTDGKREGWIFLDGSPADFDPSGADPVLQLLLATYFEQGLPNTANAYMRAMTAIEDTHTVLIPPPPNNKDNYPNWGVGPEGGAVQPLYALCIGLMIDPDAPEDTEFEINFFDFSQEPNHEYVELVNTSDEPVDIGGWTLEVGYPRKEGAVPDPNRVEMRIPQGSTIAPGGMVLLTVNKFDGFQNPAAAGAPILQRNGIGMAQGLLRDGVEPLAFVTTPPIPDTNRLWDVFDPGSDTVNDPTGSVFSRYDPFIEFIFADTFGNVNVVVGSNPDAVQYDDYIDRVGDGLDDLEVLRENPLGGGPAEELRQASATRDNVPALADALYNSTPDEDILGIANWAGPNRPWDRIIQVEFPANDLDFTSVHDIAAIVLRGGIFPNYPEYDGIDNDGDGAYERSDGIWDPGILAKDMVDNNLSGMIDEVGLYDISSDKRVLFPPGGSFAVEDIEPLVGNEGIDEGRRMVDPNSPYYYYGPGTMPLYFFTSGGSDYELAFQIAAATAGAGDRFGIDYINDQHSIDRTREVDFQNLGSLEEAAYIGSDYDPPEWKHFVQRRWYPGDNVFVTLYAGTSQSGLVADRVTYNQIDVEKRNIDTLRPSPYVLDGQPIVPNPRYPSMWHPNHMGLDFYKSLERKHPLYKGDRFGTSNRWEATNGNYDDWAESVLPWERGFAYGEWPYRPVLFAAGDFAYYRFADGDLADLQPLYFNQRLYGMALSGTPLRINAAARVLENPVVPRFQGGSLITSDSLYTQFAGYRVPLNPAAGAEVVFNAGWGARRVDQRDGQFASPGDLLGVPHMRFEHVMLNSAAIYGAANAGARHLLPMTPVNHANGIGFTPEALSLRGAMLGQTVPESMGDAVLAAAIDTAAFDPIVLSVGQAKFTPIRPWKYEIETGGLFLPSDSPTVDDLYLWRGGAPGTPGFSPPKAWAPIYLFAFDDEISTPVSAAHPRPLRFPDGAISDAQQVVNINQIPSLINVDVMFNTLATLPSVPVNFDFPRDIVDRWPLQKRIVAYVADNTARGGVGDASSVEHLQAEAIFEWDAEDGLENGIYTAYIGTFIPGLRQAFARGQQASAIVRFPNNVMAGEPGWLGEPFLAETETPEGALNIGGLLPDPVFSSFPLSTESATMALEMELFTSRQRAGGILNSRANRNVGGVPPEGGTPTGLENPEDWNGIVRTPRSDGYVLYGEAGPGTWRAIPVEVRDNYLGLRVRNLSPPGRPNMITHVVLAPRKATRGRINVNTAEAEVITFSNRPELFSALVGLPGIINAASGVLYNENVTMPTAPVQGNAWPPPDDEYLGTQDSGFAGNVPVPPLAAETTGDRIQDAATRTAALQLMALIMDGRPERPDGRYYVSTSELARDSSAYRSGRPGNWETLPGQGTVYPLSNAQNPETRFIETQERFRRLANMVTTRSDLFEIIATVQSGYGLDLDGDGFINYRSDEEFVATAESKVRSVYERRTPRPVPLPARDE